MTLSVPEVRFDESLGQPIFPRPQLKHAVLIHIPNAENGDLLPTFIQPEWGGVQIFYGDYYGIVKDGEVIYGSAKIQWEHMHTQIIGDRWVKTAIPFAYQATVSCRIVTLIPESNESVREANFVLSPGDWVVRQPGGEVQHIKAAKYSTLYFSAEEASEFSLTGMSANEFAAWAIAQASIRVG